MLIAENPKARHEMEDGESGNTIKSEVLVDESMLILERFDAVLKRMSNIVFGSTNRESNLIYFVNPTLLWSTNWSWIEIEFAQSVVIMKCKTAQWMRIVGNRDCAKLFELLFDHSGAKIFFVSSSKDLHVRDTTEK